ncbi:hypothetical protein WJX75_001247 [Coccomyxa subellipsoidea]|uniref:Uncharacterized protein n=1 Tax=Coccomyxa subellipsoidea TaxID=248742 RepID=A0ABR2YGB6_9CHLO
MFNLLTSTPQSDDKLRRISLVDCKLEAACAWFSHAYDPKKQCSIVEAESVLELASKPYWILMMTFFGEKFVPGSVIASKRFTGSV